MLKLLLAKFPGVSTWLFKLKEFGLNNVPTIAQNFLKNIRDPIRLFVTFGPGYGDQVCAVNILDRLLALGYQGSVDVIGSTFALKKTMLLMNVPKKITDNYIIEAVLENGLHVRFIDYDYFKNNNQDFPKVALAIFVGIWEQVVKQYDGNQLTALANASRALSFDPFSFTLASEAPGLAYELERQPVQHSRLSTVLPYQLTFPNHQIITQAIRRFSEENYLAAKVVKQIMRSKNTGIANTFAIYGLNQNLHPKAYFSLANLIIAAANVQDILIKPLYIMALDTMPDQSWQTLQNIISLKDPISSKYQDLKILLKLTKNITFIDITTNSKIPNLSKQDAKIIVFRMPPLPRILFNELFNSTLTPVYEGANSATLLQNLERYGLFCPRGFRFPPVDQHHLTPELISGSYYTCRDDFSRYQNITSHELLTFLMKKYSNETRPPMMEPDRVSYGVATVSQKEDCESRPLNCAFFQPAQNFLNVVALHGNTAAKGILYGTVEESTKIITQKLDYSENVAIFNSKIMRMFAQFAVEAPEMTTFMLFLMLSLVDIAFSVTSAPGYIREGFKALMLLMQYSFFMFSYDLESMTLAFSLIVTALLFENLSRIMVQTFFGKKSTSNQSNEDITQSVGPKLSSS